jgi:hypothetical protein
MSTDPDPARPAAAGTRQPSRSRAAALLAAALLAAAVLAAAPLAAAGRDATPAATPRAAAAAGDDNPCATTLTTGAHDALKYPLCAGD